MPTRTDNPLLHHARPITAFGIIATMVGIWAYQTLNGGTPDSLLAFVVFLAAVSSLIYLFGKGTVKAAMDVYENVRKAADEDENESDGRR